MGSSPRVRGRRSIRTRTFGMTGLIPAGAGQTSGGTYQREHVTAHPRGCGADCRGQCVGLVGLGSSPRVRGRPFAYLAYLVVVGLIPAGAGQTSQRCSGPVSSRAHPRGCGADRLHIRFLHVNEGSSPRVRGRRERQAAAGAAFGLIPAGAGQTSTTRTAPTKSWAHPRGCGADAGVPECAADFQGSSPRVRGRRVACPRGGLHERLIPAGAGQTSPELSRCTRSTAHPRGCGADVHLLAIEVDGFGSSPRVRGRPRTLSSPTAQPGLIPAGAGQTWKTGCQPS